MINRDLFEQIERIKADECSYMIYKMLQARPGLTIEDIELVQETSADKISFYVQIRKPVTIRVEGNATPNCPCHNEPCVWTSYNPELKLKKDHWSCATTLKEVK